MLRKEAKAYELRTTRNPQIGFYLSGVLIVIMEGVRCGTYIGFSQRFVEDVGKLLPEGVSYDSPAYLSLVRWPTGAWKLYAQYIHGRARVLLLEYTECPVWLKIRRGVNGKSKKGAPCPT